MLLGVPSWAIWIIFVLIVGWGFLFEYAHRQRMLTVPSFDVSFRPTSSGIVAAHENVYGQAPNGQIVKIAGPHNARYVRIQIDATSKVGVQDCIVAITKVAKKTTGQANFTDGDISQPIFIHDAPFRIYAEIPHTIDFLKTNEPDNKLNLTDNVRGRWPAILDNFIGEKATYRFTFKISNPAGTKTKSVDIIWTGQWDAITGNEVP